MEQQETVGKATAERATAADTPNEVKRAARRQERGDAHLKKNPRALEHDFKAVRANHH